METKHTPGPWHVEHDKEFDEVTVYAEIEKYEYNMSICEVSPYITKDGALSGIIDTEQIAVNARLIAAAPEMADALKWACHNTDCKQHERECEDCPVGAALKKVDVDAS